MIRKYKPNRGGSARIFTVRWQGPFRVKKQLNDVTFIVSNVEDPAKEKQVHVDQMKAYFAPIELQLPEDEDSEDADQVEPADEPEPMLPVSYLREAPAPACGIIMITGILSVFEFVVLPFYLFFCKIFNW